MKQIPTLLLLLLFLVISSCSEKQTQSKDSRIPKVAFLTTGSGTGTGELPSGVLIAQRFFNSRGAMFFVESRDILFDPDKLSKYDLIIMITAAGYHDADRGYSLSFITDHELRNLSKWVNKGGFLLAGDNIGRNFIDGGDRTVEFGKLTMENWPLAEALGVEFEEKNMQGYDIVGDSGFFGGIDVKTSGLDEWVLVPSTLPESNVEVKAWWIKDSLRSPAIVWSHFGRGQSVLLYSSYLLHPSNHGGFRSISQIEGFYAEILQTLPGYNPGMRLNFWPGVCTQAFSLTLRPEGDISSYQNAQAFIIDMELPVTLFHTPQLPADTLAQKLKDLVEIASGGASWLDYSDLNYPKSLQEIIQNNVAGNVGFSGFRFPLFRQSYWGLMALENLGYSYESSIRADQITEITGSVHPYHLPISSRGYYTILSLLEISPLMKDDAYFFTDVAGDNPLTQEKRSLLFEAYLQKVQADLITPYHGVMVYLGCPKYTFRNDTSRLPLNNLITGMKTSGSTWFASLSQIADRWSALERLSFSVRDNGRKTILECKAPEGVVVEDISFEMDKKPAAVTSSIGQAQTKEREGKYYAVFKGCNGQVVKITW